MKNFLKDWKKQKNKQVKVNLKKNNFRWINDEVNIVDNSKFHADFTPDIMIGKKTNEIYSLTNGNRNHFIEFSFKIIYFLKKIRISVDDFDCTLKDFKIEVISPDGERIVQELLQEVDIEITLVLKNLKLIKNVKV